SRRPPRLRRDSGRSRRARMRPERSPGASGRTDTGCSPAKRAGRPRRSSDACVATAAPRGNATNRGSRDCDYPGAMPLGDMPIVYVIGSPRSGTTWFQLMLGSHPKVATPIELDFFSTYIAAWYEIWEDQRLARNRAGRPNWGLPAVLTEDEFEQVVTGFVEQVY